ncbi:MAG: hypothetical protein IJ358_04420 [Clostridia bacterium]|nr:hypothetical protein [Clostridia bacterium]
MSNTQIALKKWLKLFIILCYIGAVVMGFALAGTVMALVVIAINKDILTYKVDDTTTIADMFAETSITSRGDIMALMATTLIYITLNLVLLILIIKWLKSTDKSLDPFSKSSVTFMRKTAKFIYIATIIGFIIESIIIGVANNELLATSDYSSFITTGLVIHFLSYIFAYANERKNKEIIDHNEIEPNNDDVIETK